MINAVRAEFRKLLTVRSTYGILIFTLALMVLFGGYIFGIKLEPSQLANPTQLQQSIVNAITAVGVIGAFIGVFLMAHEYRYNTIMYSLTASRHRTTVLGAKIIAVTVFSLLFTVFVAVLTPLLSLLGVHLAGHQLTPQSIAYGDVIWRVLFYGWGYAMAGLLITVFVRNFIGSFVVLLIVPSTIESLLSLLLKENSTYLPFSSLGAVIQRSNALSYGQAAIVFTMYLIIGWLIAWWLFMHRDAN